MLHTSLVFLLLRFSSLCKQSTRAVTMAGRSSLQGHRTAGGGPASRPRLKSLRPVVPGAPTSLIAAQNSIFHDDASSSTRNDAPLCPTTCPSRPQQGTHRSPWDSSWSRHTLIAHIVRFALNRAHPVSLFQQSLPPLRFGAPLGAKAQLAVIPQRKPAAPGHQAPACSQPWARPFWRQGDACPCGPCTFQQGRQRAGCKDTSRRQVHAQQRGRLPSQRYAGRPAALAAPVPFRYSTRNIQPAQPAHGAAD